MAKLKKTMLKFKQVKDMFVIGGFVQALTRDSYPEDFCTGNFCPDSLELILFSVMSKEMVTLPICHSEISSLKQRGSKTKVHTMPLFVDTSTFLLYYKENNICSILKRRKCPHYGHTVV